MSATSASTFDELRLMVMSHAFSMIAEEMGTVLTRGSLSPNIRERLDASCALFDARGVMIAQAAHIPVHLGALPESVQAVMHCSPEPDDIFVLNDPFRGGSHLPDITMVQAVSLDGAVAGFTAVRAHHADVGGMSPGSMPNGATEIFQEGIIIPPVRISRGGILDGDILNLILANVRTPTERRGDLRAQMAACAAGARGWLSLVQREGREAVAAAAEALLDYTERRARARIAEFGELHGAAMDYLEGDGVEDRDIKVRVEVSVDAGRLLVNLAGTDQAVRGNVNCPIAVTRAAAIFVLRTLLPDDVPTNAGIARALEIRAEENSLVNAAWPSAVAAGNVELSQRITDTIFAALADAGVDVPAQGQGTMNNVTFGAAGWTFYETLGGGQGGSSRAPGPDAVHVGMSNTRNTPIESLEHSYPLLIQEYAVRRGSGGKGLHRGGDGVVRSYEALVPCRATLVTERRRRAPAGATGGGAGTKGRNSLNGVELGARCTLDLQVGDVLTVETPGGGAWGVPGE